MTRLKKCKFCSDFEGDGNASYAQILATAQSRQMKILAVSTFE
jgi:hypothetical protein